MRAGRRDLAIRRAKAALKIHPTSGRLWVLATHVEQSSLTPEQDVSPENSFSVSWSSQTSFKSPSSATATTTPVSASTPIPASVAVPAPLPSPQPNPQPLLTQAVSALSVLPQSPRASLIKTGLALVPKSGELWVEAARELLPSLAILSPSSSPCRNVDDALAAQTHFKSQPSSIPLRLAAARLCLMEASRCTGQCGDVFSERLRLERVEQEMAVALGPVLNSDCTGAASTSFELAGMSPQDLVVSTAISMQPNYGTQWTSFYAWPSWDVRDRTVDVMTRALRALDFGTRGKCDSYQAVHSILSRDLTPLRVMGRFNLLFGGDTLV